MSSIINELERDTDKRENLKKEGQSISGALRLAQEYEATHGRVSLDNLLQKVVPDNLYEPSTVHSQLLELPWADVFTTNWDTLLERAADGLLERNYERLMRIEDIPLKQRPRLVKLHGSFPSNGPFILTEDDFRTYPQKFAPFINLVQQSMMENVLCLVGFSGDDPNFLAWSGWVRDNLGDNSPRIYLCGMFHMRSGQRRMLEARGVTVIDLLPIFDVANSVPLNKRHEYAIDWFFKNLKAGQPPDILEWPSKIEINEAIKDPVPMVPEYSGMVPKKEKYGPSHNG